MRRFFFTILFIAGAGPAIAQQAPVKTTGLLDTGLTINDCLLILQGMNAIDQREVVVQAGKPNEQVVRQSYEYGNGALRLAISRNISVLTGVQRDAQAAQQRIFVEVVKGAPDIKPGTPEAIEYDRQLRELTSKPCQVDLVRIKDADLKLDRNEIPAAVLSNLDKIRER